MKRDWMIKESQLDDDQIAVLTATLDKSCIVTGCAGSGKSVLALIKAQRIQKERGNNYKIIVFTKALCQYMNSGRKELGLTNQFQYHWHWRNRTNCSSADYIIVDEIQDFEEEEIQEFINATGKYFFFFGDTAQSIYEGLKKTMNVEDINDLMPRGGKAKTFPLYRNYRLPVKVAKLAQYVGIDLPPFNPSIYKSPETAKPFFIKYSDINEQLKGIARIIKDRGLTDVGILVPQNEKVKDIWRKLCDLGLDCEVRYNDKDDWRDSKDTLNFSTTNPKVMTYHSAKGLQFEAVFLPVLEDFEDDDSNDHSHRKSLYVAMTRTYRFLFMMFSDYLEAPLSDIIEHHSELYEDSETEIIEDM